SAQSDGDGNAPAASVPADNGAVGPATGQAPGGAGVPSAPSGGRAGDGGGSATAPAPESADEPGFGAADPYARDPYGVAPDAGGGAGGTGDPYAVAPYEADPYDDGEYRVATPSVRRRRRCRRARPRAAGSLGPTSRAALPRPADGHSPRRGRPRVPRD